MQWPDDPARGNELGEGEKQKKKEIHHGRTRGQACLIGTKLMIINRREMSSFPESSIDLSRTVHRSDEPNEATIFFIFFLNPKFDLNGAKNGGSQKYFEKII